MLLFTVGTSANAVYGGTADISTECVAANPYSHLFMQLGGEHQNFYEIGKLFIQKQHKTLSDIDFHLSKNTVLLIDQR